MSEGFFEIKSLSASALAGGAKRPGWEFLIPGELLLAGSPIWSDEDREKGITVRCVYLTLSDKVLAARMAQAAGAPQAATIYGPILAIDEINGKKVRREDKEPIANALGTGLDLLVDAYARATRISDAGGLAYRESFRLTT